MSQNVVVCNIDKDLADALKEFRFSKKTSNQAIVMKVDRESMSIKEDFRLDDCTTEMLVEELPSHQPRFLVKIKEICIRSPQHVLMTRFILLVTVIVMEGFLIQWSSSS